MDQTDRVTKLDARFISPLPDTKQPMTSSSPEKPDTTMTSSSAPDQPPSDNLSSSQKEFFKTKVVPAKPEQPMTSPVKPFDDVDDMESDSLSDNEDDVMVSGGTPGGVGGTSASVAAVAGNLGGGSGAIGGISGARNVPGVVAKNDQSSKGALQSDKPLFKQKRYFTPEEDSAILKYSKIHGKDWEKILAEARLDRTKKQVRERFNRLTQKKPPSDNENSRDGQGEPERPRSPTKRGYSEMMLLSNTPELSVVSTPGGTGTGAGTGIGGNAGGNGGVNGEMDQGVSPAKRPRPGLSGLGGGGGTGLSGPTTPLATPTATSVPATSSLFSSSTTTTTMLLQPSASADSLSLTASSLLSSPQVGGPPKKKTTQLQLHEVGLMVSASQMEEAVTELQRKLAASEEKLRNEMDRTKQLERELHEQQPKMDLLKQEYQNKLTEFEQDYVTRTKKSVHTLLGLLKAQAQEERKRARLKLNENCLRLASVKVIRQGAGFQEVLEDGYAFRELKDRQEAIAEKREELEKLRKSLGKRKPASSATSGSSSGSSSLFGGGGLGGGMIGGGGGGGGSIGMNGKDKKEPELDEEALFQQDEFLKNKLLQLKKEEADLAGDQEKLEKERELHVRELKRIYNEDQSRFNDLPVLNKRYLLMSLLGKGGFSEVYKAYDIVENMEVACKIHQLNSQWNEDKKANYTRHAVREYQIHKELNHPRMVSLHDVFEIDQNSFCTVLEYCNGGDLEERLKEQKLLQEKEAKVIIMQIFSGLKYLNTISPPIIHYDLKPGNILFDELGAKITDFGLAKIHEDGLGGGGGAPGAELELTSQGAGTYWYLPPECFEFGKTPPKISSKVDVWSVGVIFYQMLFGKRPFGDDLTQHSILTNKTILLGAKQVEFPAKPQVSQEAKDFIKRCLIYNKDLRPEVLVVCEDPYLKQKGKASSSSASSAPAASAPVPAPAVTQQGTGGTGMSGFAAFFGGVGGGGGSGVGGIGL